MKRGILYGVILLVGVVVPLVVLAQEQQARDGKVEGQVITIGEDRIVIEKGEGGQMTLEAGWVQREGQWVRNEEHFRFFKSLKQGDRIVAGWVIDGGHYFIREIVRAGEGEEEQATQGRVQGKVITTGEDRVVIEKHEGGQMTLEAGWVQKGDEWVRNEDHLRVIQTLQPGDPMVAHWRLGDGGHFILQEIALIGPDGKAIPAGEGENLVRMSRELHAMREEMAAMRQEIAELKALVQQLVEASQK